METATTQESSPTDTLSPSAKQKPPKQATSMQKRALQPDYGKYRVTLYMRSVDGCNVYCRFGLLDEIFDNILLSDLLDEVIGFEVFWNVCPNNVRPLLQVFWNLHIAPLIELRRQETKEE